MYHLFLECGYMRNKKRIPVGSMYIEKWKVYMFKLSIFDIYKMRVIPNCILVSATLHFD